MKPFQHNRWIIKLLIWAPVFAVILLFIMMFSVSTGSADLDLNTVWFILLSKVPYIGATVEPSWRDSAETIVWDIRMPRIILGVLVGAALAASGVVFQGVLRNPLADPYILGVSSGAALGASLVMLFGIELVILGQWTLPIVAFFTGFITLIFVYYLARVRGQLQIETLILAGVIVQAFFGAVLSLILALSEEKMQIIMYWIMGSLALTDWSYNKVIFPFLIVGLLVIWFLSRELNMLILGEEAAQHTGVNVQRVRVILLIVASLITGAAVSVSGTIGFVGLIIPHIMRLIFGSDHRLLFPLSVLGGAIFMVGADTIARTILAPRELPIGIITAFLGAPFFGYLLRRRKNGFF